MATEKEASWTGRSVVMFEISSDLTSDPQSAHRTEKKSVWRFDLDRHVTVFTRFVSCCAFSKRFPHTGSSHPSVLSIESTSVHHLWVHIRPPLIHLPSLHLSSKRFLRWPIELSLSLSLSLSLQPSLPQLPLALKIFIGLLNTFYVSLTHTTRPSLTPSLLCSTLADTHTHSQARWIIYSGVHTQFVMLLELFSQSWILLWNLCIFHDVSADTETPTTAQRSHNILLLFGTTMIFSDPHSVAAIWIICLLFYLWRWKNQWKQKTLEMVFGAMIIKIWLCEFIKMSDL